MHNGFMHYVETHHIFYIYSTLLLLFSLLIRTTMDEIYEDADCGQKTQLLVSRQAGQYPVPWRSASRLVCE